MPYLNTFRVGADPEFIIVRDGHMQAFGEPVDRFAPWGLDHGGWVIEPHPKPSVSVREVIANLKIAMNDFALRTPEGAWRAGAYYRAPERTITLGGHVHIDMPQCSGEVRDALDGYTQYLEALDILPREESRSRRTGGAYGNWGDVRSEHGHFEYRSMCSWLFSQRAAKLCLLGGKLLSVEPRSVTALGDARSASVPKLRAFFEQFQHRDDDVDWLLTSGILRKRLVVNPDRDLREVWKVAPAPEDPHWKQQENYGVRGVAFQTVPLTREPLNVPSRFIQVGGTLWCFPFMGFDRNAELARGGFYQNRPPVRILEVLRVALREGERTAYLEGFGDAQYMAQVGAPWPEGVGHLSHRVSIGGRRYTFWLSPTQLASLHSMSLNSVLREAVLLRGKTSLGVVYFYRGLMFQIASTEGENIAPNEEI
jgi:hypothetical protein